MSDPALSYQDVLDAYKIALSKDLKFTEMDVPSFARYMNQSLGTDRYRAGEMTGVKRAMSEASLGLDDVLKPAGTALGEVGSGIGEIFGETGGRIGRRVGEALPRAAVDLGLVIGGLSTGGVPGALLAGTGAASAGSSTLAETGSTPAAVISGAATLAAPIAGATGGRAAVKYLTPQLEKYLGTKMPFLTERVTREVGEQGAMAVLGESARQGVSLVTGQGLAPITAESIGEQIASNIPFLPLSVPRLVKGYKVNYPEKGPAVAGAAGYRDLFGGTQTYPRETEARRAATSANVLEPSRAAAEAQAAFNPEQLQGPYGLVAREQLNTEKPYGVAKLPGDFLPGNTVIERMPKVLPQEEWTALKNAGIEEFVRGRRVGAKELDEWIGTNGPRIEVKELTSQQRIEHPALVGARRAQADLQHQLETLGYRVDPEIGTLSRDESAGVPSEEAMRVLQEFTDATQTLRQMERLGQYDRTTMGFDLAQYDSVVPHADAPQKAVLVRLNPGSAITTYKSPHFGHLGEDLYGWARMQYVTDPQGRKTAHVIEVQSDWSQARRSAVERAKEEYEGTQKFEGDYPELKQTPDGRFYYSAHPLEGALYPSKEAAHKAYDDRVIRTPKTPYDSDYNRLLLKAAIDQALKDGADRLVISDAETAMMTEGHDLASQREIVVKANSPEEAIGVIQQKYPESHSHRVRQEDTGEYVVATYGIMPSQAPGMRLNYDTSLPSVAKELTGDTKPERVSLGEHQKAFETPAGMEVNGQGPESYIYPERVPRQDLIFRNPDGTPKTDASGLSFDLTQVRKALAERRGFTLFGRDKINANLSQLESQGARPDALVRAAEAQRTLEVKPGETLAQAAAREVGLSEVLAQDVPPGEFLLKTQQFFSRLFDLKGETGARKDFLVRQSILIAARFEKLAGRTRLAEVLRGPSFYAPRTDNKFNAILGLRTTKVLSGRDAENLRILWDASHEMMHAAEAEARQYAGRVNEVPGDRSELASYLRALDQAATLSLDDKQQVLQVLIRHAMPGASEAFDYKTQVLGKEPGAENSEFLADFGGLLALGGASDSARSAMKDYVFFNDKPTTDLAGLATRDLTQTFSAVRDYLTLQLTQRGKLDDEIKSIIRTVESIQKNLSEVLGSADRAAEAADTFRGMMDRLTTGPLEAPPQASFQQVQQMFRRLGTPGVWIQKADIPNDVLRNAEESFMPVSATKVGGVRAKWWERFMPMTQFAANFRKEVPEFEQATQAIRDVPAIASQRSFQMWKHWVDKDGKWDSKRMQKLGNMNNPIAKAFSAIALFQNAEGGVRFSKDEIKKIVSKKFPGLTDEDIDLLDLSFQQAEGVHKEAAQLLERGMMSTLASRAAMLMMQHSPNLRPAEADRLGQELVQSRLGSGSDLALQGIAGRVGSPEAFTAALEFIDSVLPQVQKSIASFRERPGYFSEVRPGEWLVAYKDLLGNRGLEDFQTQAEAQKRLEQLQKNSSEYQYIRGYNKLDTRERWRGVSKDLVNTFIDADKAVYEATLAGLKQGGADAQTLEALRSEFEPGDGALRIWTPPYMQERQFIQGREKLNMMEQMMNYVAAVSYGSARRHIREKVELIQKHPGLRTNPAMSNSLRRYATEMLDAAGPEWQKIKNFLYFNTLGFQLSTGIINTAQNFMVGAPLLMRYGAKVGEAYKYMTSAAAELGQAHLKNLSLKTPKFANEEHAVVIERGEHERVIDKGTVSEYFALDDELGATRRSMASGNGKFSQAKDLLSNASYHMLKLSRDFFMGYTEQFNQRAALLAGYDFARQKLGKNQEEAYLWSKQFVQEGNFGGGRYNRPELFNGLGKGFGAAGLAYTLNGYTFNLLGVYARLAKDALGKTGQDSAGARKALGAMLTAQALMGGAVGLPMAAGLIAVLEQLFPDLEVKKTMREAFTTLGGGDTDLGHLMGDIGMSGVLTGLTGADVGSRFQLGTFMGVDPYNGFQLQNLAGPTGGLIENMIKATQQASTGQFANATEKVLPAGLRGLWRSVNQDGGLRNAKGQLLFDSTPAEQALVLAGFRPKRLAHYYESESIRLRSEEIEERRLERLYDTLATQLLAGDQAAVRAGLMNEARESIAAGQRFDPVQGLRRVVEVAQARTVPVAQRGPGQRGTRSAVEAASLYPSEDQGSEVSRVMSQKALERSVGIPGAGRMDKGTLRMAQMVDQLREMNPTMSVAEARRVVQRAFARPVAGL